MCLRIEVSNKLKCFGNLHLRDYRRDIRRTFNSTQGSSRPHTMHISPAVIDQKYNELFTFMIKA